MIIFRKKCDIYFNGITTAKEKPIHAKSAYFVLPLGVWFQQDGAPPHTIIAQYERLQQDVPRQPHNITF